MTPDEQVSLMEQMVQTLQSVSANIETLAAIVKELRGRIEALEKRPAPFHGPFRGAS